MKLTKAKFRDGIDITVHIGEQKWTSYWASPPQSVDHLTTDLLETRYKCLSTEKRIKKFRALYKELMKDNISATVLKPMKNEAITKDYAKSVESLSQLLKVSPARIAGALYFLHEAQYENSDLKNMADLTMKGYWIKDKEDQSNVQNLQSTRA